MNVFKTIIAVLALVAGAASAQTTLNTIGGMTYVNNGSENTTSCNVIGSTTYCN